MSAGILCCVLLSAGHVRAQADDKPVADDLSLNQLLQLEVQQVSGASRYQQDVTEAPSSISIITADDIQRFGYRNLAEVLAAIKGVYLNYDRTYHYLGLRGFNRPGDYNTRFLILIDGNPLNDNIYSSAGVGTDFSIDIDIIKRVEVIRGPSSSLYGTNAFFGVINVITKDAEDFDGAQIGYDIGSFTAQKARVSFGKTFSDKIDLLISGTFRNTPGPDLSYTVYDDYNELLFDGTTKGTDYDRSYRAFLKAGVSDLELAAYFMYRKKGIPNGPWGIAFDQPDNQMTDILTNVLLKYNHACKNNVAIAGELSYLQYDYLGDFVYWDAEYDPVEDTVIDEWTYLNKDNAHGKKIGLNLRVSKKIAEKLMIIAGGDVALNPQQDQKNFDEGYEDDPYMDEEETSHNGGIYLQAEFQNKLGNIGRLTLNGGLRFDYYQTFGSTFNPRVALIYNPIEKTAVKVLFGTAFRAPNNYELYYNDGEIGGEWTTMQPNPSLNPEEIRTIEGVFEQYIGRNFRVSADGFSYTIDNLITQMEETFAVDDTTTQDLLIFRNADGITAYGAEFEVEARFGDFRGLASYSYQRVEDVATGTRLTDSPKHIAKLNVSIPVVRKRVFLSPEFQYIQARKTLGGNYTDDSYLANVTLLARNFSEHRALAGLSMSASVYNLFDSDGGDPGSGEHPMDIIKQDGRTWRARITYGF